MYRVQLKDFFGKIIMDEEYKTKEEAQAVYDEQKDAYDSFGETTVIMLKNDRPVQSNKLIELR